MEDSGLRPSPLAAVARRADPGRWLRSHPPACLSLSPVASLSASAEMRKARRQRLVAAVAPQHHGAIARDDADARQRQPAREPRNCTKPALAPRRHSEQQLVIVATGTASSTGSRPLRLEPGVRLAIERERIGVYRQSRSRSPARAGAGHRRARRSGPCTPWLPGCARAAHQAAPAARAGEALRWPITAATRRPWPRPARLAGPIRRAASGAP